MSEYDATIIYMPLEEAQLYFNRRRLVQSIEIFVDNPDNVDALRPKVRRPPAARSPSPTGASATRPSSRRCRSSATSCS
jgi:hypothetical protein